MWISQRLLIHDTDYISLANIQSDLDNSSKPADRVHQRCGADEQAGSPCFKAGRLGAAARCGLVPLRPTYLSSRPSYSDKRWTVTGPLCEFVSDKGVKKKSRHSQHPKIFRLLSSSNIFRIAGATSNRNPDCF